MTSKVLAKKNIAVLRDVSAVTPVERTDPGRWPVRSGSIERRDVPENYLSPYRQDFYKMMLIVKASGVFTMGALSYELSPLNIAVKIVEPGSIDTNFAKTSAECIPNTLSAYDPLSSGFIPRTER